MRASQKKKRPFRAYSDSDMVASWESRGEPLSCFQVSVPSGTDLIGDQVGLAILTPFYPAI